MLRHKPQVFINTNYLIQRSKAERVARDVKYRSEYLYNKKQIKTIHKI